MHTAATHTQPPTQKPQARGLVAGSVAAAQAAGALDAGSPCITWARCNSKSATALATTWGNQGMHCNLADWADWVDVKQIAAKRVRCGLRATAAIKTLSINSLLPLRRQPSGCTAPVAPRLLQPLATSAARAVCTRGHPQQEHASSRLTASQLCCLCIAHVRQQSTLQHQISVQAWIG